MFLAKCIVKTAENLNTLIINIYMAKGIVSAKSEIHRGRHDEFPLKVIYSDTEPARNYIWGHPNGQYYVWTDCKWVRMELPDCNHHKEDHCCNNHCCDCITKDFLEVRLEKFKKEILSAFLRIKDDNCDDSEDLIDVINELRGDLNSLSNTVTNLTGPNGPITNLQTDINNLQVVDADTDARLDDLEDHDSRICVTAKDPEEDLQPID